MYLFSFILTSFVLNRVWGALTPSGSVTIDCGGQRNFTCVVTGTAGWTIDGLMGIAITGGTAGSVAAASARVTTTDTGLGPTSTITITGFSTSDNEGVVQCVNIGSNPVTNEGMATISVGPPQCGLPQEVRQSDETGNNSCPYFPFTLPQGSPRPLTVMVSYQLRADSSLAGSLTCDYPIDAQMCNLNVTGGIYTVTLTPANNCGSPSPSCISQTAYIPSYCSLAVTTTSPATPPPLSSAALGGIIAAGIIVVVVSGAVGYPLVLLVLACTCYSSIGFCGLLKCKCFNGKARRSSSKQRIGSASPVTPPAQPTAQAPADEYADPQAIRDRKESGKEDKDKLQYAAIDFSAGAGSGAGEVKIHQKEEPVIYTTVQHV